MKQVFLNAAIAGYLACAIWALLPAPVPVYVTAAYICMAGCALLALPCVSRTRRWLAIVAVTFGLIAAFISRQDQARAGTGIIGLKLTHSTNAPTWIRWSSTVGGNNHYYALTPFATNWAAAQDLAVSWGGHLATITSANGQDFINDTFLTGAFDHLPVWIGLVRSAKSPTGRPLITGRLRRAMEDLGWFPQRAPFEWVTGELFSYSNWKPGEPNDTPPGENCVAVNWEYSDSPPRGIKGDWNDTPVNGTTGYGGATDGPYFGLVERGSDPSRPPILTLFQLRWVTLAWLLALAGFAATSLRKNASQIS